QDYYMDYDRQESRFPLPKKVKKGKAIDIGSDVMLDQERCVLCGRCTRFFDEVTKTSELAFFERGDHNRIDIFPGRKVDNNYAGNVIDICPVGALTEKDFRFRMRVWYLHRTPSVCAGCERGCSIDIYENHGKIFRYKPRHNPLVNGYWMCDEGRHSFKRMQTETRITSPLYQSGDRMMPEGFASAIRRAADAIRHCGETHGGGSIGALVDAHATNEEIFALKSFIKDVIGSDQIGGMSYTPPGLSGDDDLLLRANKNPNTAGLVALGVGLDGLDALAPAVASGQIKTLIALRADACRALGEAEFVKRFGALDYLILLDTDASETAQMANQVIPIAAYPELDGTFTNFQGVVQRLHRAFDPPGEAKSAIEVLTDLGMVLDGVERPQTAQRIFAEIAGREAPFAGLDFDQLGHNGAKLANS
ncbi:MAG TPA: molybdopterin-dependent oxidoreductase, partial [Candidatus Binataceae bacterium]|nr:molybdopterin-dependent oxidoreductase [Candidatus Binataceae bacterium]